MKKIFSLAIMTLLSVYGFGQTVVTPTEGPLTKLTFNEAPNQGTDILVELEYTSTQTIAEGRVYFQVTGIEGAATDYVKDNKVKSPDEKTGISQTELTLNLKDADVYDMKKDDGGVVKGQIGAQGQIVKFYIRVVTEDDVEYFYDKDGNMILNDEATGGTDNSDDIKDNLAIWSELTIGAPLSNNLFKKASVSLYPIPAGNDLTFKSGVNEIGTFEVFNMSGKLMTSAKGNLKNNVLNISKLNSGNYILKVSTSSNSQSFKFTK